GRVLPTGNPKDRLDVPGVGIVTVSIVDMCTVQVYVRAADLGLTGCELPDEVDGTPELLERLEAIRGAAAVRLGMATSVATARRETGNAPHLVLVSAPQAYTAFNGDAVAEPDVDLVVRMMFMQRMHKAYAAT